MSLSIGASNIDSQGRYTYLRRTNARSVTISTSTSEFTSHPDGHCYSASSHSRKLHMDMNNHPTSAGVSFGFIHTEWGGHTAVYLRYILV